MVRDGTKRARTGVGGAPDLPAQLFRRRLKNLWDRSWLIELPHLSEMDGPDPRGWQNANMELDQSGIDFIVNFL